MWSLRSAARTRTPCAPTSASTARKLEAGGGAATRRGRGRRSAGSQTTAVTVEGAVAQARAVLEQALAGIDGEVDAAKAKLDAAQADYDELVASVKTRKAKPETKIKALS